MKYKCLECGWSGIIPIEGSNRCLVCESETVIKPLNKKQIAITNKYIIAMEAEIAEFRAHIEGMKEEEKIYQILFDAMSVIKGQGNQSVICREIRSRYTKLCEEMTKRFEIIESYKTTINQIENVVD